MDYVRNMPFVKIKVLHPIQRPGSYWDDSPEKLLYQTTKYKNVLNMIY